MSLVEKALEKMHAARAQSGSAVPKAVPRVAAENLAAVEATNSSTNSYRVVSTAPTRVISLNPAMLRQSGMLPPEHEENAVARQYRQIKRPLIAAAMGRGVPALPNGRLLMVASGLPGDGKTFTSTNLALSIAKEKDINVVLADADVAKRHLSMVLGAADEPGLLDLLREPTRDVNSVIFPTDIPQLSVLPAGRRGDNSTELLSSNRMEEMARQLLYSDPDRIVVFDSPPLILTTESQALAHIVGQVVVVVRAGVTPQSVVLDAIASLGDRPVSLILNQSVAHSATGYYYGYGDGREGSST
ncbi:MAG: hypothetical protein WDO68_20665 [Gammaproteobacteria bacterium]